MKKLFLLIGAGFLLSSYTLLEESGKPLQKLATQASYTAAVVLSQSEVDVLTADFQKANGSETWGGLVDKNDLKSMIQSIPSGDNYVNFRFAKDPATGQTSLMFMGGKSWFQSSSRIDCLRNGGKAAAFCPSNCMVNSEETTVTVDLSFDAYNQLAAAYQKDNPAKTWGGNIDKQALLDIIASLPANMPNVSFRFCKDTQFSQTSIIFLGGANNRDPRSPLFLRNGVSAEAFCPSMCNVRS